MKDITIETFANWETQIGIFGKSSTPLMLQIDIKNNTNIPFDITGICVSLKTNFLFFDTATNILRANKNETVLPNSKFTFKLDIQHLRSEHAKKNFTIKVFGKNKTYESEKLSIRKLETIQAQYS